MAFYPLTPIRCLDDVRQLETIPLDQHLTAKTTYEIFQQSAIAFGDNIALRFLKTTTPGDETISWSYNDLLKGIHQTANLLHNLEIEPDQTISILLPGCLEYHLALWGGEAAGIVNPLNPLLTEENLIELAQASNCRTLIAYSDDLDSGYWTKALTLLKEVPSIKTLLRVSPIGEDLDNNTTLPEGIVDFYRAIKSQRNDCLMSGRQIKPDDIAAYFHTGGTTGSPKLAIHTHGNQVFTAWACVQLQGINHTDITINGFPLFHVAGVLPGSLASLSAGVETIIPTHRLMRNPEVIRHYWKLVEYYKVTVVSAVPTALGALAAVPLEGADISSVTFCRTGAAPLPAELARRYKQLFNLKIQESLGMTEMAGISSITPPGVDTPVGCVGFPLPFSRYKIMALKEDGTLGTLELATGETGMIVAKSPNVFPGYLDKNATQDAFTEDGWLITGDLGFIDKQGRLNLNGRSKDLIIRSAHNIDPKMIEEAIETHPNIELCAAVGAPDSYAGEVPVVFVTLKNPNSSNEAELLAYAADKVVEIPARPKMVTILDAMPLTNVGKIYKPELRRLAAIRAVQKKTVSLLQDHSMKSNIDVSADVDKKGKISIKIALDLNQHQIQIISAELDKFPLLVQVVASHNKQ